MLDGGAVFLLAKIIVAESELSSFVIGIGRDQFVEKVFLFGRSSPFAPAWFMRMTSFSPSDALSAKAHRFVQMGEEFLGSGRIIGASQLSGGELRIKRERFIKML